MGAAEHRIKRLIFDVPATDEVTLEGFGAMVRARFDAVIAPALEAALDRIDIAGQAIRLHRVEIDIGTLAATPDPRDLARRIIDALAAALPSFAPRGPAEDRSFDTDNDDTAELVVFLQSGIVPWAEPGRALALLATALLKLNAVDMGRIAVRLRTALIRRRQAERLVHQLPGAFVRRLLRALLPQELSLPLASVLGADGPSSHDSIAPAAAFLVPRLVEALHGLASGRRTPELGEVLALFVELDSRLPATPAMLLPGLEPSLRPPREALAIEVPPAPRSRSPESDDFEPDTPIPVHAAGAVLLHPFIGTFFGRLDLLAASGGFRDGHAMERAVLLAHHLATGADEAPEPETILFKLLCGMPFSTPLPRRTELGIRERQEAQSVLTSVVTYWHRLGQTTPAGLREAFLLRPGQLQRKADQWRLAIERRGVDILLDHLPWALSWVKTPFMRAPLTVDWR